MPISFKGACISSTKTRVYGAVKEIEVPRASSVTNYHRVKLERDHDGVKDEITRHLPTMIP
jgi:hypothetical protein